MPRPYLKATRATLLAPPRNRHAPNRPAPNRHALARANQTATPLKFRAKFLATIKVNFKISFIKPPNFKPRHANFYPPNHQNFKIYF